MPRFYLRSCAGASGEIRLLTSPKIGKERNRATVKVMDADSLQQTIPRYVAGRALQVMRGVMQQGVGSRPFHTCLRSSSTNSRFSRKYVYRWTSEASSRVSWSAVTSLQPLGF
jgi:hypothetical protein